MRKKSFIFAFILVLVSLTLLTPRTSYAEETSGVQGGDLAAKEDEAPTTSGQTYTPAVAYPGEANLSSYLSSLPAVRNQGSYGTCWAFATVGLAELDLIKDGSADKTIDLSELGLAYFLYHSVEDPLGGTSGDTVTWNDSAAGYSYLNYGASLEMATRRMAQWCGPTTEANVPYANAYQTVGTSNAIDSKYAYSQNAAYMLGAYKINLKTNPELAKKEIVTHGGIGISYYSADWFYGGTGYEVSAVTSNYYLSMTPIEASSKCYGGYHSVIIVGWDDNYSANNFVGNTKPSRNGAWLVRNSWGNSESYFWMSYEDKGLVDNAWAFDYSATRPYDNNYQLDGGIDRFTHSSTKVANIFTTQTKEGVSQEILKAVSLSFSNVANVTYTIEVYKIWQGYSLPLSGDLVSTTVGTTTYAGVYTIPLTTQVSLNPGEKFSVVVTMDKAAMDTEEAVSISDFNTNTNLYTATVALADYKSYYLDNGYMMNYAWGNFCLKAFTDNVSESGGSESGGGGEAGGETPGDTPGGTPVDDYTVSLAIPAGYDTSEIYLDGIAFAATTAGTSTMVNAESGSYKTAVVFQYNDKGRPSSMYVWTLKYNTTTKKYEVTAQPDFENLLGYKGASVRLQDPNGIRVIFSIDKNIRTTLSSTGINGFVMKELGTLVMKSSNLASLPFVKGGAKTAYSVSYGYDSSNTFQNFVTGEENGRYWIAHNLVGMQPNRYKSDYSFRPYIVLEKGGEQYTIYGPIQTRNMYSLTGQLLAMEKYANNAYLQKIYADAQDE